MRIERERLQAQTTPSVVVLGLVDLKLQISEDD
jgi:hypothetical protein